MEGKYEPQTLNMGQFCIVGRDDELITKTLQGKKSKIICINDDSNVADFEMAKKLIIDAFEKILPDKSSFEW